MTSIDDRKVRTKLPPSETRAAGRFNAAGVPTEKSKDFSGAVRRLGSEVDPGGRAADGGAGAGDTLHLAGDRARHVRKLRARTDLDCSASCSPVT